MATLTGPQLYESILSESTKLQSGEIKELVNLISSYDEAEELLYNVMGLLNDNVDFTTIKDEIDNELFDWQSSAYAKFQQERELEDAILERPPEIREGENECPKCHQKKTLVVEMQTRSADEGYTYYIHCFNPKCRAITR